MNIFQIVEQTKVVSSNTDLAGAFDDNEWTRIVNHFVTDRNGSLGDNRNAIDTRMDRFHQTLGMRMEPGAKTPSSWNLGATRYNMDLDITRPTWQDIYNHLAPHATSPEPENYRVSGTNDEIARGSISNTPMQNELYNLVDNGNTTTWSDYNTFRDEFATPFYRALVNLKGTEWTNWLQNDSNRHLTNLTTLFSETIRSQIESDGSITKDQAIQRLYHWLTQTDYSFEAFQNRN